MKSSYKPIGDHIRLVDERNIGLNITTLLGLSITKEFIPSVANTIGSDMENYKIVRKNQFACSLMQVRRDKKIPVAMLREFDEAIISQAYPVFEVIDEMILNPEYLMMWFSRSEFDRESCFYAVGGVRGSLEWEDFCNMQLPVPSVEKQKEIVEEYNIIVCRIKLNKQLNQKLEETAQAIYKQWFVDFEFPDDNGKPYKSSSGEMVFCDELQKDIPTTWKLKTVKDISKNVICGKTPSTQIEANFGDEIPFLTIPDMHDKVFVHTTARSLSKNGANTQANKTLPPNSICVSCIASPGIVVVVTKECQTNQQINSVICKDNISFIYAYFLLSDLGHNIREWGIKGSVGANMNKTEFEAMEILVASEEVIMGFNKLIEPLFDFLKLCERERLYIQNVKSMLISRMVLEK